LDCLSFMVLSDIKKLTKGGENDVVEFKKKAAFPLKIIRELVAFANTKGGWLLVGVDDNGTVSGLKYFEEDAFALEEAIRIYCRPQLKYKVHVVNLSSNKGLLAYYIVESKRKPHFVLDQKGRKRKAYIRINDKTVQASREVLEIMKRTTRKENLHFNFGIKEKLLMEYLEEHQFITVGQFEKVAHLTRENASNTLVKLTLANVISLAPQMKQDIFTLAPYN